MLNAWINTRKVWYAFFEYQIPEVDEDGNYTGEQLLVYGKPHMTRANLSASRGVARNDVFGLNTSYSKTMSTSKMNLGIDEQTLIWDEQPTLLDDNSGRVDPKTAKYRVAAIAQGHYHIHYALRQMNVSDEE